MSECEYENCFGTWCSGILCSGNPTRSQCTSQTIVAINGAMADVDEGLSSSSPPCLSLNSHPILVLHSYGSNSNKPPSSPPFFLYTLIAGTCMTSANGLIQ